MKDKKESDLIISTLGFSIERNFIIYDRVSSNVKDFVRLFKSTQIVEFPSKFMSPEHKEKSKRGFYIVEIQKEAIDGFQIEKTPTGERINFHYRDSDGNSKIINMGIWPADDGEVAHWVESANRILHKSMPTYKPDRTSLINFQTVVKRPEA